MLNAHTNNRIAINMIQSYLCSTQTPNNIYLGSTLIPKVEGVCDGDLINLGITSNTHLFITSIVQEQYIYYKIGHKANNQILRKQRSK